MLRRSEDRRVSASSGFNFSDSAGMKECGDSDANTSLKGRRVSLENDLGDVSCDSEVMPTFFPLPFLKNKNEAVKTRKEKDGNFCFLAYSFFVSHHQFVELQLRGNLKSLGGITRVPKRRRCH